jgi:hypothetical protein
MYADLGYADSASMLVKAELAAKNRRDHRAEG